MTKLSVGGRTNVKILQLPKGQKIPLAFTHENRELESWEEMAGDLS